MKVFSDDFRADDLPALKHGMLGVMACVLSADSFSRVAVFSMKPTLQNMSCRRRSGRQPSCKATAYLHSLHNDGRREKAERKRGVGGDDPVAARIVRDLRQPLRHSVAHSILGLEAIEQASVDAAPWSASRRAAQGSGLPASLKARL